MHKITEPVTKMSTSGNFQSTMPDIYTLCMLSLPASCPQIQHKVRISAKITCMHTEHG